VTPYYQDADCTIYNADCLDVLPTVNMAKVALIIADPPYGIGVQTNYKARKRTAAARCQDFGEGIIGDRAPFNPAPLLALGRPLVLFGANHYAHLLPPSPSWFVWDKLNGLTSKRPLGFNDSADIELAWSNLGGPARILSHRWMGMVKEGSEARERRVHPTQKPIELMAQIIECFTQPGDLVLDPYMGSGPVIRAAKELGRRSIGIELDERYCKVTVDRLPAYTSEGWEW
jgi:site-specific DNA-methyltransferase (adenine-specific)